jgi:hypothetical protein
MGELLENPATRAVLVEVIGPPMFADAGGDADLAQGAAYSLDFIAGFVPDVLTEDTLRELHARLSRIPKKEEPAG